MGQVLDENGYKDYSSAVRPMAIAPGERIAYLQLSFLHGFVEFDLETDKPLRIANLPVSEEAADTPRENYLLDSAHHGLAINHEGTKLCAAGTMSDYAAIVQRDSFANKIVATGSKPYWATNSADGKYCFVSFSGDDKVTVLDYASERAVADIPVGDHPQRMRMGLVRTDAIGGLPPSPAAGSARAARKPAKLRIARARVRAREARRAPRNDLARHRAAAGGLPLGRPQHALLDPDPAPRGRRAEALDRPPRAPACPAPQGDRHSHAHLRRRRAGAPGPAALARGAAPRAPAAAADDDRRAGRARRARHGQSPGARRRAGCASTPPTSPASCTTAPASAAARGRCGEPLPSRAAEAGGQLSIQYTGRERRRIRGESLSKAVAR